MQDRPRAQDASSGPPRHGSRVTELSGVEPAERVARAARAFADFHQCLHAQQQSCWEDLDLTMSQFKALMLVAATGGLSGRDLARRFGVGPSAITAIVEKLVQRGYVRREEDIHDRRISWTRPTPAAMALFQQVNSGHDEQLEQILTLLPPEDLPVVGRALDLLRDAGARWLAANNPDAPTCTALATPPGDAARPAVMTRSEGAPSS